MPPSAPRLPHLVAALIFTVFVAGLFNLSRNDSGISADRLSVAWARPEPAEETPQISEETKAAAGKVEALANEFMMGAIGHFPEFATLYGLPFGDHGAITDNSFEGFAAWQAKEDSWLDRLLAIDPAILEGHPHFITYGFLKEQLNSSIDSRVCRGELWGVSQLHGWQSNYPQIAKLQPVGTSFNRDNALRRFGKLPEFIDNEIAWLEKGLAEGYSAPKKNVERVIEQIDGLLVEDPKDSPFYNPAGRDSAEGFGEAFAEIIAGGIQPALERYRDYLAQTYLPAAREDPAISALPDGDRCYQATVRGFTTLSIPPQEIHETGKREMMRIRAEMEAIGREHFGTSDVAELLKTLKTDPKYRFGAREDIVAYARAAIDRGKASMGDWFGLLPKAGVEIEQIPEFEEKSAPRASYMTPAEDGSRGGLYRLNTYQPTEQSRVDIESTAFHESIPGHHLQRAIQQERPHAHPITRYLGNSGFIEGWGLYAERLADEMGLFSGPVDRVGMLSNHAFRAARMVVDPGIHALGWSREQAIEYMLENTAMNRSDVEVEVDRYIIMPGQATAYMVGYLEISSLRQLAEESLGDDFDIREFHDRVLEDGGITLPMLHEKITKWVEEKRGASSD